MTENKGKTYYTLDSTVWDARGYPEEEENLEIRVAKSRAEARRKIRKHHPKKDISIVHFRKGWIFVPNNRVVGDNESVKGQGGGRVGLKKIFQSDLVGTFMVPDAPVLVAIMDRHKQTLIRGFGGKNLALESFAADGWYMSRNEIYLAISKLWRAADIYGQNSIVFNQANPLQLNAAQHVSRRQAMFLQFTAYRPIG